tara:strand:+ start:396 stop:611 length:216 start_codon:yes stop_codon:yes gene_type:complete
MDKEEKARYYDWLLKQYQINENQISKIPQLTIEEQSKSSNVVKYSPENLKKVNHFRQMLQRIQTEMQSIMQ